MQFGRLYGSIVSIMAAKKSTAKKASAEGTSFAVVKAGGKQYIVAPGMTFTTEKLSDDHKAGDSVVFDEVLLVDDGKTTTVGKGLVSGVKVTGTVHSVGRLPKVTVIKYKAKSRYFKKRGHRQPFTKVTVSDIT